MDGFSLDQYLKSNIGFIQGVGENFDGRRVDVWLELGGHYEDIPYWYMPYLRSVNHFHNPLTEQGFSGFVFNLLLSGDSSVQWAQEPEGTQEPGGYYSWHDVRDYYHTALTSAEQNTRSTYFAQTFRGLGQLMHLVQDLSVPEHTRDDAHIFNFPWTGYEKWVSDRRNVNISSYNPVFFDLAALGQPSTFQMAPVPIANLFDTNQYTLASGPDATIVPNIGLAEYTGANFLSWDTVFTSSYPYPRIESTELWTDPLNNRQYLRKTTEGVPVDHLAVSSFLYFYRLRYFSQYRDYLPLGLDSKVYENYASLLLPRAIGYSASLLNYFFRGTIELTPPDRFLYSITAPGDSFTEIRVNARNVTANGEEMPNGSIQLVVKYRLAQQDPFQSYPVSRSEDFYHIVAPEKNGVTAIPRDTPVELVFDLAATPIPLWATDVSVQVVYRGILGNEAADAVAVGFKDISEPTPVEIINNMDYVCIEGSYYVAGSAEALSMVDTNLNGIADEADIYPHKLSNVYLRWTPPSSPGYASASNYNAWISEIQPGSYGRVFILTEYEHYLSNHQTLIHPDAQDQWTWYFGDGLHAQLGLKNQSEYINGVLTRVYPTFETIRGINAWTGGRYENPAVPYGASCITPPPTGLTGPVGFGIP